MKVIVDRSRCIGIGICESVSSEHFEVADDGVMHVLQKEFEESDREVAESAVAGCPAQALRIAK